MVVRSEHGLGHESAGVVIEVGKAVTTFKEGLHIYIPFLISFSSVGC